MPDTLEDNTNIIDNDSYPTDDEVYKNNINEKITTENAMNADNTMDADKNNEINKQSEQLNETAIEDKSTDSDNNSEKLFTETIKEQINDETKVENNNIKQNINPIKSKRERRPNSRYNDFYQFFLDDEKAMKKAEIYKYDQMDAIVLTSILKNMKTQNGKKYFLSQTYNLKKGIIRYDNKAKKAATKEILQLDNREVFWPIHVNNMTKEEKKKVMNSLIFLTEKRDGTKKARACASGNSQRHYLSKEKAPSPMVSTESILITSVIDTKQKRDVVTLDIPNAFVQTPLPEQKEKVNMRIMGQSTDLVLESLSEKYNKYINIGNGVKVIYVEILSALYGMMMSSLLFYKHFRKDIALIGFKVNQYIMCKLQPK